MRQLFFFRIKRSVARVGVAVIVATSGSLALPNVVLAQGVSASTAVQRQQLSNLQASAGSEINRRLASLNAASDLLKNAKVLPADTVQNMNDELAGEVQTLVGARKQLEAATNVTDARAAIAIVDNEYPTYVLAARKGIVLGSTDFQLMLEQKVAKISVKMEGRMNAASDNGKDVSQIQTIVSNLQSHLQTAQNATQPIAAKVAPVKVGQYEALQTVFASYQTSLNLAHKNLQDCQTDIEQLGPMLQAL